MLATKPRDLRTIQGKKWLKEFSWLRYNSEEKKMYCELCRFHSINIPFAKEGWLFIIINKLIFNNLII